jgi:indole-3-glycerol phosphate synthase
MANILSAILDVKRAEIRRATARQSMAEVRERALWSSRPRGFIKRLKATVGNGHPAVIAEIKRASPSRGLIRQDFMPDEIAQDYERHGASCISVLTDVDFFGGSPEHLVQARAATRLPMLRKDFLIDPYQIYESRALGADCVLLIVAALPPDRLLELLDLTRRLGMDALVEVHTSNEIAIALQVGAEFIGINNRDLTNFSTDIQTTIRLSALIPSSCLIVSESGIATADDVGRLNKHKINVFLIGEAFMRCPSPGQALSELFSIVPSAVTPQVF